MEKVKSIIEFIRHVDQSVETMLDGLATTGYDKKFDLKLEMNGKPLALDMNADTYCSMEAWLLQEVRDELMGSAFMESIDDLACMQCSLLPAAQQIRFEHTKVYIGNPFMNVLATEWVNPIDYYGKAFLLSDWFNEGRVNELELEVKLNAIGKAGHMDA